MIYTLALELDLTSDPTTESERLDIAVRIVAALLASRDLDEVLTGSDQDIVCSQPRKGALLSILTRNSGEVS